MGIRSLSAFTLALVLSCAPADDPGPAPSTAPDEDATSERLQGAARFSEPALWVDDFRIAGLDDCEHDAIIGPIIADALAGHVRPGAEVPQFEGHRLLEACIDVSEPQDPDLTAFLRYRLLLWNCAASGRGSVLGHATDPSPFAPFGDVLTDYLRAGGNVIIWGRSTIGAMLGDFYPSEPYTPDLPLYDDPNFGPGSFVWDVVKLRTQLDRVGRSDQRVSLACGGLVGLEATPAALAAGLPAGIAEPTGYDPTRVALWADIWSGADNPRGIVANGAIAELPYSQSGFEVLYRYIPNAYAYEQQGIPCGTTEGAPFDGMPVVTRYADPLGRHGKVAWIGTALFEFAERHPDEVRQLLRGLVDWALED